MNARSPQAGEVLVALITLVCMCLLFYGGSLKTAEAKCIVGRVRTSVCVCICVCVRKGLIWGSETVLWTVRGSFTHTVHAIKTAPPTLKVTFST